MNVQRTEVDIQTRDGQAHAFVYRGGSGASPGVILYIDAFGVRPVMQEMAERIAGWGCTVLLPNVLYRAGAYPPFDVKTVWSDPPEKARLMGILGMLTHERLAQDTGAYLDALTALPDVQQDRVGATGYCLGGRVAMRMAEDHPHRVRAFASFHGGGLVTDKPDSPHLLAKQIRASVYFGVADLDAGCNPEMQGALAKELADAHLEYRLELYPGMKHGFAVSDHAGAYDPRGAKKHWQRLQAFLGETLGTRQ